MIKILLPLLLISQIIWAQSVGINESNETPHPGAILDVKSTDQGVLLPRTTPGAITNPAAGMIIYDISENIFKYYTGTQWRSIIHDVSFQYFWADQDGDGFGSPYHTVYAPMAPSLYVTNDDDCNDNDPDINPSETDNNCDGIDDNCNGSVDESCSGNNMCCSGACVNILTNVFHCGACGNACDDGLACTMEVCTNGNCIYIIQSNKCLIGGVCYNSGQTNPDSPCLVCNPAMSQTSWSIAQDGTFCPPNGVCVSGTCVQF